RQAGFKPAGFLRALRAGDGVSGNAEFTISSSRLGLPRLREQREVHVLRGSCLCGGVKYQISGRLFGAMNCHCSMCRKAQGSAFRRRASVKSADVEFMQGEELITFYESSPGNYRGFCQVCGSPILSKFDAHPEYYGLPLGGLDDDPGIKPKVHVHV